MYGSSFFFAELMALPLSEGEILKKLNHGKTVKYVSCFLDGVCIYVTLYKDW